MHKRSSSTRAPGLTATIAWARPADRDQVDSDQATISELLESYAYVVHNNVNHLFKFMAALIILATIPLFIPGAAAMNVPLGPFPHWRYGFDAVTGGLVLVEMLTAWAFYRKGWLRLD